MDEQLTYARKLQAAGYTLVQIRDILLQRGIDQRTVFIVLNSLPALPDKAPATPAPTQVITPQPPLARTVNVTNPAVYKDYAKGLRSHGVAWDEIDKNLSAQGISAHDRSKILAIAHAAEDQALAAKKPNQALQKKVPQAPTLPALKPKAPPTPVSQIKSIENAEEKLAEATDHLGEVVNHLSDVVDKLDEEIYQNGARTAPELTAQQEKPASKNPAGQLASVTDHLANVVEKLRDDIKRPPPPPTPPSTPNATIAEIAATLPPSEVAKPPSVIGPVVIIDQSNTISNPVSEVAETPTSSPTIKLNYPLIGSGLAIFSAIFIYSLLAGHRSITWLALISMNVVGTAGFDLILRGSSWQKVDRWLTATILQTGLFVPFFLKEIVRPIHFPHYTIFDITLLLCAVTALIIMQFCNVKALQYLEASVFSVIYNARILFATVLGYLFLSESVGLVALIGGLLIFLAIFIVRQRGTKAIVKQGLFFGLGAALAMSSMNTCEKELIKLVGYEQYIFPMFTIAAIIMWVVVFARHIRTPVQLMLQPRGLGLMALRACAGIGFSYSLVFGPVAVSSYLSSLNVVLLVVFGMLFLGERDYFKAKLTATGTAILGLTLILFDSL